jgi:hypothetical protein
MRFHAPIHGLPLPGEPLMRARRGQSSRCSAAPGLRNGLTDYEGMRDHACSY